MTQEVLIHALNHVSPHPAADTGQDCLIQLTKLQTVTQHLLQEDSGIKNTNWD